VILYVDYSALCSNAGPSAAAYSTLRLAGHHPDIVFGSRRLKDIAAAANRPNIRPPVLVTDDDEILASLPEIIEFARQP
jgi:hypothetical protein